MTDVVNQCAGGKLKYGGIADVEILFKNLEQNAIPRDFLGMDIDDYESFLIERRKLMARKIRDYYYSL